jgi:hypothetical protein
MGQRGELYLGGPSAAEAAKWLVTVLASARKCPEDASDFGEAEKHLTENGK